MGLRNWHTVERPEGMEEDCIGSQGPQRTVVLEKKKIRKKKKKY
jgi:hypothetical protein